MESSLHITSSVIIRNSTVLKDGNMFFENPKSDFAEFISAAYKNLGSSYPKFHKMDNLSKLGWYGAESLLQKKTLLSNYAPDEVGIVFGNVNSSLDTDLKYFESTRTIASPALFVYTLPNIVTGEICIRHNIKGENAFFVAQRFDAPLLYNYTSSLFNTGAVKACICGWIDILGENYEAVIYLVENGNQNEPAGKLQNRKFTITNIQNLYQKHYG